MAKTVVLIDGNALMHRSYHGMNRGFIPMLDGMPVGMVYGFASTLLHIIEYFRPEVIMATFDTKEKTFRHEMDEDYKAHREKAPDDFYPQIPYIYELLESFEIPVLKLPGYESDDIAATIAKKAEAQKYTVYILSNDQDFLQLASDHIKLAKFNGKISEADIYGPQETYARYGIYPEQMVDFKAIIGDSSDNYKGIPGIGPKTAAKLLQDYNTLNNIFDHIEELNPKLKEKFEAHKDYVHHCQTLAQLHTDVPIDFSLEDIFGFSEEKTQSFFGKMSFPSLNNRYQKMVIQYDKAPPPRNQAAPVKTKPEESQMALF